MKQKSGLNRAILDQGWSEFRRQLVCKLAWNRGMLLALPPHNEPHLSVLRSCIARQSANAGEVCLWIVAAKITLMWWAR